MPEIVYSKILTVCLGEGFVGATYFLYVHLDFLHSTCLGNQKFLDRKTSPPIISPL